MALVLIVEDAWFTRRVISKTLQASGHIILEAANGQEGIEKAITRLPDCILLDLLMPDMDGREVLKFLHAQGIQIPTIVITADIQESSRRQCLELGAIEVLSKPPQTEMLNHALEKALSLEERLSNDRNY